MDSIYIESNEYIVALDLSNTFYLINVNDTSITLINDSNSKGVKYG